MSAPTWSVYQVHADKHAIEYLSIDEILLATDGGLYRTTDGFQTWSDADLIPNTQYYRVTTNPHIPAMVLAGAQDNGTTLGFTNESDEDHIRFFGGDGFTAIVDPEDPTLVYTSTQNGNFYFGFTDFETFADLNFLDFGIDQNDRVNWDAPIVMDPIDNSVLYTGNDPGRPVQMSIFPNPASGMVDLANAGKELRAYEIYSMAGKMVKAGNFPSASSKLQISVADLAAGTYIAVVYDSKGEKAATGKLIVSPY